MSSSIYKTTSLVEISFFQKLFKQFPQENAVIELNNLLASKPIKQVSKSEIIDIEDRYNFSLEKEFKLNLEEFYAVYLNYCLEDKSLSDEEIETLKHLKSILSLDQTTIDNLHTKIGAIVYRQSFEEAVSDGRLTDEENRFLDKLESDLSLSKQLVEKISVETRTAYIDNYVAKVVEDQRLSPEEENEIKAIASSLNIDVKIDAKTQQQLEKLKLYWALENLPLPIIQPDIVLQKSEQCYFQLKNIDWHELRSVRHKVSSSRVRIAKGIYLGSRASSYSTNELKLIDIGSIYLTNKRIIYTGSIKNINIRLEKILNITPYSDGVEITKETGKNPFIKLREKADIFCIILERLIREQ